MRTLPLAALLFLSIPVRANAGPWHYVKTHKALLLMDAITVGSAAVESYTSNQCLRDMRLAQVTTSTCTKQGNFFLELSPALLAANHVAYHFAPTSETRYAPSVWVGLFATGSIDAAVTNIKDSSVPYLRQTWGRNTIFNVKGSQ